MLAKVNATRTFRAFFVVVTAALAFTSCESNATDRSLRNRDGWIGTSDSVGFRIVSDSRTTCADCIEIAPIAILGDMEGPGYVVATDYVVRDSMQNYWVGQYHDMIKVFDSKGNFVRQVGRSGAGPMEFRSPLPIYVDATNRVHILDPANSKETVITSNFSLHAEQRMEVPVWSAVPLLDGGYVVNAVVQTSSAIGLPLHVVKGPDILHSFGRSGDAIVNPAKLYRVLASDDSGRIYSASYYRYAIDVWREDGSRITGFRGPDFSEPGEPRPGLYADDNPPRSKIVAMHVDDSQRLWLLISVRRNNWRENMKEARGPNGQLGLMPIDDNLGRLFRTRIEVIDLSSGSIVARTERDEYFDAFLGDGSLLEDRYNSDGTPQVAVWKARFTGKSQRKEGA
jgi:hypothetical protein